MVTDEKGQTKNMYHTEQVPTGVLQKQANLCVSGTNFILIKTKYLQLFMGFKYQNTKKCFSQNFKNKNIVFKLKNVIMR